MNPLLPGNTDKCLGLVVNTGNQQLLSKTQLGAAMVGVECSGQGKEPAAYIRMPNGKMCNIWLCLIVPNKHHTKMVQPHAYVCLYATVSLHATEQIGQPKIDRAMSAVILPLLLVIICLLFCMRDV